MTAFDKILSGGDLRSIGKSNSVVLEIKNQNDFDALFPYLFHKERLIVMRAADAIEKITIDKPQFFEKHKNEILELLKVAKDKELKWHLALFVPRLHLEDSAFDFAWSILTKWTKDASNSRIVRVNSIQGLFEMTKSKPTFEKDLKLTLLEIEKEDIPSLNTRLRKIKSIIK